jgi:opine dehydrogenase
LFSAYGAELDMLRASSGISLRGAGPVGSYHVDRSDAPSVQTTAELDRAVAGADAIFLTGPVHKQRTYAMVLADHLSDGQILVLAPARSLGALETAWYLRIGGCTADVTIVEAQGLPYWITATGSQLHLSEAAPVAAATLPAGRLDALSAVSRLLTNLTPCDSVLASGFADGTALVEIPSLLLSGPALSSGALNIPMGGQPLAENQTFASLIGTEHRAVISRLAAERHAVAKCFGVRNLPDAETWIDTVAGAAKGDAGRPIPDQTAAKALLRDGVIGSLVPLVSAAQIAGVDVPVTQSMITLASTVLRADVAAAGRRLDTIGITENDIDSARRAMDAIATGAR